MRRLALMGSLACLAAGCGNSEAPPGAAMAQATPLTQQAPFTPQSIVFDTYAGGIRSMVMVFSDGPSACQDMRAHRNRPHGRRMALLLQNQTINIPMATHYPIYASQNRNPGALQPSGTGELDTVEGDCSYTKQEFVDGHVLVESIDVGTATAVVSYDLVLEDGSRWQGRWQIKHCSGINTASSLKRDGWTCAPAQR